MLGLFHAVPGARAFRRPLATEGGAPDAGAPVLRQALSLVTDSPYVSPRTAAA